MRFKTTADSLTAYSFKMDVNLPSHLPEIKDENREPYITFHISFGFQAGYECLKELFDELLNPVNMVHIDRVPLLTISGQNNVMKAMGIICDEHAGNFHSETHEEAQLLEKFTEFYKKFTQSLPISNRNHFFHANTSEKVNQIENNPKLNK